MDESQNSDLKLVEREFLALLNQMRELQGEAPATSLPEPPFCSFCGRGKNEVGGLIEGIAAHICDACATEVWQTFRTRTQNPPE
jgi:hypothetical protein